MNKTYCINSQKALSETLDGETIIINLESGSYYSMNHPGTAIWNAISQGLPISTTSPDVSSFLDRLVTDQLVEETTESDKPVFETSETPKLDKYDDMQEMLLADPVHDVDEAGWPKLKENK